MKNLSVYAKNITELLDMRDAVKFYGFELSKSGFMLCPFHNEDTPSLKVYRDGFYCFGCGAGGDVISFVRRFCEISFPEAVKKINSDFALNLPVDKRMTIREERAYKERLREIEKKREAEAARRERKINEYNNLLYSAVNFEIDKKRFAPKSPYETPHPLFINAIMWLDYVNYALDSFDWEED